MTTEFNFDAYLNRIGLSAAPPPTAAGLAALHLAHATHIPFENLDILLGRRILLDAASLQRKLVDDKRGGYCFEHNTLFALALKELGFNVTMLAARVRQGTSRLLPRTHMLLLVEAEGRWLADVGFGGAGLLLPLRLEADREQPQFAWINRVVEVAGTWVLQVAKPAGWQDLYAFTLEPQEAVDYEVANYYVSTHSDSRFTQTLVAQLPTPEARYVLRNRELTVDRGTETQATVVSDSELPDVLARVFGLSFPAGVTFPDKPWGA